MKLEGLRDNIKITVESDNVGDAVTVFQMLMAKVFEEPAVVEVDARAEGTQIGFFIPPTESE